VVFVGSGRGKLLLFGEHAAVYGHPAVGLSLDSTLRVKLQPAEGGSFRIPGVRAEDREPILRILDLLETVSGENGEAPRAGLKGKPGGGLLLLESQIPRGLGFGSSASLCVALATAVAARRGEGDLRRIWEWAHRAEALFHGTPSGIDTGLALLGGLYSFQPHPPELPEAERLTGAELHLVVGAVPRKASAGRLIGSLREKVLGKDRRVVEILEQLGVLAAESREILRSRSDGRTGESAATQLARKAVEAQELLSLLELSTPELDRLLREGRNRGALGGKLSGAGGGGAFFLICGDPRTAGGVAAGLRKLSGSLKLPTAESIRPLSWRPEKSG
jgi:mevalonate kinase